MALEIVPAKPGHVDEMLYLFWVSVPITPSRGQPPGSVLAGTVLLLRSTVGHPSFTGASAFAPVSSLVALPWAHWAPNSAVPTGGQPSLMKKSPSLSMASLQRSSFAVSVVCAPAAPVAPVGTVSSAVVAVASFTRLPGSWAAPAMPLLPRAGMLIVLPSTTV